MSTSRRDTLWGFFSSITPLVPLIYMLSSWQRLRYAVTETLRDRPTRTALALLFLSSAISTAIAPDRLSAVGGTLALFLLIAFVVYGKWGIERPLDFLRGIVLGCGFLGLVVVLARVLQLEIWLGDVPILTRFSAPRGRGNVLGMANNGLSALLEPGAVGGLGLALLEQKRRPLYLVSAVLSIAGVFVTLSRGGALGMFAAMGLLAIYSLRHLKRYWKPFVTIALAIVLLVASWPPLADRLATIAKIDANIQRIRIWTGTWLMIKDNFLFGSGPANFGKVYPEYRLPEEWEHARSPHSLYLYILSGWGLTGFLLFFGFVATTLLVPVLRDRSNRYRVIALTMAASFWVHVLVEDLYIPHIFLIMGCVANEKLRLSETAEASTPTASS